MAEKNSKGETWQEVLTRKGSEGLDQWELNQISDSFGVDKEKIKSSATSQGIPLNWQIQSTTTPSRPSETPDPTTTTDLGSDWATLGENYNTSQQNIATINAGAATQSASIKAEADKQIAQAYADAQRYGAELGLEGVKYGADKESEWRQAVSNIETKGKLDLQGIINSGLERVANIEKESALGVADLTSSRSLEGTKYQSDVQKDIGKMSLAGSMYGLIGSIFG